MSISRSAKSLGLTSQIAGIDCSKIRSIKVFDNVAGQDGVGRLAFSAPESGYVYQLSIRTSHLDSGQVKVYKFRYKSLTTNSDDITTGLFNAISNAQGYTKFPFSVANLTIGVTDFFEITEKPIGDEVTGEVTIDFTAGSGTSLDIKLDREGVDKSALITFSVTTAHVDPIGDPKVLARIKSKSGGRSGIRFTGAVDLTKTYDVIEVEYKDSWTHGNPVSAIDEPYHIDTVLLESTSISAANRDYIKQIAASIGAELGLDAEYDEHIAVMTSGGTTAAGFLTNALGGGTYSVDTAAAANNFVGLPLLAEVGTTVTIINNDAAGGNDLKVEVADGAGLVNGLAFKLVSPGGGSATFKCMKKGAGAAAKWASL
jgi:hypothetical protein